MANNSFSLNTTTNFSIKANTDSKILYSGIVLDSLSLEVNSTSDATKVRPLAFKIADGNGSGSLVFRHEKDLTKLELDIDIKGADRPKPEYNLKKDNDNSFFFVYMLQQQIIPEFERHL